MLVDIFSLEIRNRKNCSCVASILQISAMRKCLIALCIGQENIELLRAPGNLILKHSSRPVAPLSQLTEPFDVRFLAPQPAGRWEWVEDGSVV